MARTAQPRTGSRENSYGPSVDGALAHRAIDPLLCATGCSRGRTGGTGCCQSGLLRSGNDLTSCAVDRQLLTVGVRCGLYKLS